MNKVKVEKEMKKGMEEAEKEGRKARNTTCHASFLIHSAMCRIYILLDTCL